MKRWIAVVSLVACFQAYAQNEKAGNTAKKSKAYGPPVKLDISGNECIKKGDEAYIHSLFYEEFKTLAECRSALQRRS